MATYKYQYMPKKQTSRRQQGLGLGSQWSTFEEYRCLILILCNRVCKLRLKWMCCLSDNICLSANVVETRLTRFMRYELSCSIVVYIPQLFPIHTYNRTDNHIRIYSWINGLTLSYVDFGLKSETEFEKLEKFMKK